MTMNQRVKKRITQNQRNIADLDPILVVVTAAGAVEVLDLTPIVIVIVAAAGAIPHRHLQGLAHILDHIKVEEEEVKPKTDEEIEVGVTASPEDHLDQVPAAIVVEALVQVATLVPHPVERKIKVKAVKEKRNRSQL